MNWDYKVIARDSESTTAWETILKQYGDDGWELVGMSSVITGINTAATRSTPVVRQDWVFKKPKGTPVPMTTKSDQ